MQGCNTRLERTPRQHLFCLYFRKDIMQIQISFENTISVCRPLERTVTLHKDMNGQLGFLFKKGRITSIVKDSSAARNGLLTDHQICEINGQNIIGLKVNDISILQLLVFLLSFWSVFVSLNYQWPCKALAGDS